MNIFIFSKILFLDKKIVQIKQLFRTILLPNYRQAMHAESYVAVAFFMQNARKRLDTLQHCMVVVRGYNITSPLGKSCTIKRHSKSYIKSEKLPLIRLFNYLHVTRNQMNI